MALKNIRISLFQNAMVIHLVVKTHLSQKCGGYLQVQRFGLL